MQFSCSPERESATERNAISGENQPAFKQVEDIAWAALQQTEWTQMKQMKQEEFTIAVKKHSSTEDSHHLQSTTETSPFHKIKNDLTGPFYVVTFSPKDPLMLGGGFYVFVAEEAMAVAGIVGAP